MKKIDYHLHTSFSADSDAIMEEHILSALNKGLDEICFTDHRDFCYPFLDFDLDCDAYFKKAQQLKEKYKDQITIKIGVELGLDCNYVKEINQFVSSYPFDYVIGSIHVIKGTEFFEPAAFFEGKTKEEAHKEFFEETLKCVQTFDCFNCLGHLDYIVRYGPYDNKTVNHQLHQDIIDEIFKTLISKGKGIEVNTSGYRDLVNCGFPNFEQVKRYYDLGGKIITVGTDSHTSDRVGEHVEVVLKKYREIGFENISTFTNRQLD